MTRSSMFAALFLLCALSFLSAQWGQSWEEIKASSKNLKSIDCTFTQKKTMKLLSKPLVSKGRFIFRKPDAIRWEYESPVKSLLLINKGRIARYTEYKGRMEAEPTAKLEGMRVVFEEITRWMNGNFDDNPMFVATYVPGRPARIEIRPKDKSYDKFVNRIVLTLSESIGIITSVEIVESEGNSTLIEYENVKLNEPVDERLFEANP